MCTMYRFGEGFNLPIFFVAMICATRAGDIQSVD